ncbi:hypothetical protein MIR68_001718 [Amoeboaphelidium protococcarum]|nr:hypothetical protein MIR68_001718 [Amoeboaphelidium protococcarum]
MHQDSGDTSVRLQEVFYSDQFECNLFPVACLDRQGYKIHYGNQSVAFIDPDGEQTGGGKLLKNDLYVVDASTVPVSDVDQDQTAIYVMILSQRSKFVTLQQIHERCSHENFKLLKDMIARGKFNKWKLDLSDADSLMTCADCMSCVKSKMTRRSYAAITGRLRSTRPLEVVHTDLMGPMKTQTPNHKKYTLVVVDDYTGYAHLSLLHDKESSGKS